MSVDLEIKLPTHHYVGFQKRDSDTVPLGFMTPDGEDAASVKRKATVDSWAKGYGHTKTLESITIENKPMLGFSFRNCVRRYGWGGGGNVKWRIEDPRGFELEISSENLAKILEICTIENGEIQQKCIWGRRRNENVLLPENSEEYKAAIANTARLLKSASLKDIKRGDFVVLQNGTEGTYLGTFFSIKAGYRGEAPIQIDEKRKHFIAEMENGTIKHLHVIGSPKVSSFEASATEVSIEDAERMINDACKTRESDSHFVSAAGYGWYRFRGVCYTKLKPEDFVRKDIQATIEEAKKKHDVVMFEEKGELYAISGTDYSRSSHLRAYQVDRTLYESTGTIKYVIHVSGTGYWKRSEEVVLVIDSTEPRDCFKTQFSATTDNGYKFEFERE